MRPDGDPPRGGVPIDRPWAGAPAAVLRALGVDADRGLDADEVRRRRQRHGPNRLRATARESAWRILVRQFANVVVALLLGAAALSLAFGETANGIAVLIVIAINAGIGFVTELRAVRSMEALRRLGRMTAKVVAAGGCGRSGQRDRARRRRDGRGRGRGHGRRAAHCGVKLQVDESMLTGESRAVAKQVEGVERGGRAPRAREHGVQGHGRDAGSGKGSSRRRGWHRARPHHPARRGGEARRTPLERGWTAGSRLVWVDARRGGAVVARDRDGQGHALDDPDGIALAVATIPEGLPIVATLALARGMCGWPAASARQPAVGGRDARGDEGHLHRQDRYADRERMTLCRSYSRRTRSRPPRTPARRFECEGERSTRARPGLRAALATGVLCNNASLAPRGRKGRADDRGSHGSRAARRRVKAGLSARAAGGAPRCTRRPSTPAGR